MPGATSYTKRRSLPPLTLADQLLTRSCERIFTGTVMKKLFKRFAVAMAWSCFCATSIAHAQSCIFNNDGTYVGIDGLIWYQCLLGQEWRDGRCTGEPVELDWASAMQEANKAAPLGLTDWYVPRTGDFTGRSNTHPANTRPSLLTCLSQHGTTRMRNSRSTLTMEYGHQRSLALARFRCRDPIPITLSAQLTLG